MAYQPYTIRTSSKNEKKAKKAEKRKTAAVRNSAINMQIKWGIKNAVNVIFSIISFVSVYLYILYIFVAFFWL